MWRHIGLNTGNKFKNGDILPQFSVIKQRLRENHFTKGRWKK